MKKVRIEQIRFWLFWALIIGMPLSLYPSLALPAYNFTSFRIGLYQTLAMLFVLFCALPTLRKLKELFRQNRIAFISILLLAIIAVSGLFFSIGKSRSLLLVVSLLFLLSLIFAGWWYTRYELSTNRLKFIYKSILYGGIIYSLLAIIQFIIGSITNDTLVIACKGCVSDIFGFPRVNLFAAEPQFFANALLPFFFASLAGLYKKYSRLNISALILISVTLTLTFSRGAYIAAFIGLVSFLVLLWHFKLLNLKKYLLALLIIFASGLLGFVLMISSASWHYRSTPNIAYNTTRSMLEHITLGIISLPEKSATIVEQDQSQPASVATQDAANDFESPGLIEASTNDRLGAAELALKAWHRNWHTTLFGVGTGNLGPYVVNNIQSTAPSNLTVYIYYVLILAEVGMIGLLSFLLINISGLWQLIKRSKNYLLTATLSTIMLSFLVQYFFFGTYINTVYIWLFTGLVLGISFNKFGQKKL